MSEYNIIKKFSNIRTFSSLKNPAYRLYYIGMMGQWSSMNMDMLTRSLLTYRISGSGFVLGLVSLAHAIPLIIASLYGGAIADRLQKKRILFFSMCGLLLLSLTTALLITTGYLSVDVPGSWWIIILISAIQGTVFGLSIPAMQSIISEIVAQEQVLNAVSLNMMGMNTFRILAPAASGFLIEAFGFSIIYYIATAMYAMAAFCMFLMPKTTPTISEPGNALMDILDGLRYVRREKTMLLVLVATLFMMICGVPFLQLMPMITEDILNVGSSGQGIILAVLGIGAIISSLTLASLPNRKRGIIMLISGIIMGLALVGFAFSRWWPISVSVAIFIGMGQASHRANGNSLAQNYTDPEYRGRVMSFMMMGIGFSSLGTFFAGILAEAIGIEWAMGSLAILLVAASFVLLTFTPRVRELD
jgi:MFS family permease